MNLKNCSLMLLSTALFLVSCSKDGADGKTMLTRTTKEAAGAHCTYGGTKFETGIDADNSGTLDDAEVTTTQTKYVCDGAGTIYSSWIDVNVVDNTAPLIGEGSYDYKQTLPATAITADIVNKGIVLMYYKNKAGFVSPVDRDDVYGIRDADASGALFNFYVGFIYKEGYLAFLAEGVVKASINDNGSAIRYVLVPGDVQGRTIADLKKLPYSEVAKLYNIQD